MVDALFVYDVALLIALVLAAQAHVIHAREREERGLLWCGFFFVLCLVDHIRLMGQEFGVFLAQPALYLALTAVFFEACYHALAVVTRIIAAHLFDVKITSVEWGFFLITGFLRLIHTATGAFGEVAAYAALAVPFYMCCGGAYLMLRLVSSRQASGNAFYQLLLLLAFVTAMGFSSVLLPPTLIGFPLSGFRNLADEGATVAYLLLTAWYFKDSAKAAADSDGAYDLDAYGAAHGLSARECEVMRLIASPLTYAQIGAELWIGESTVKTHARRIYKKLGVQNRAEFSAAIEKATRRRSAPGGRRRGILQEEVPA